MYLPRFLQTNPIYFLCRAGGNPIDLDPRYDYAEINSFCALSPERVVRVATLAGVLLETAMSTTLYGWSICGRTLSGIMSQAEEYRMAAGNFGAYFRDPRQATQRITTHALYALSQFTQLRISNSSIPAPAHSHVDAMPVYRAGRWWDHFPRTPSHAEPMALGRFISSMNVLWAQSLMPITWNVGTEFTRTGQFGNRYWMPHVGDSAMKMESSFMTGWRTRPYTLHVISHATQHLRLNQAPDLTFRVLTNPEHGGCTLGPVLADPWIQRPPIWLNDQHVYGAYQLYLWDWRHRGTQYVVEIRDQDIGWDNYTRLVDDAGVDLRAGITRPDNYVSAVYRFEGAERITEDAAQEQDELAADKFKK